MVSCYHSNMNQICWLFISVVCTVLGVTSSEPSSLSPDREGESWSDDRSSKQTRSQITDFKQKSETSQRSMDMTNDKYSIEKSDKDFYSKDYDKEYDDNNGDKSSAGSKRKGWDLYDEKGSSFDNSGDNMGEADTGKGYKYIKGNHKSNGGSYKSDGGSYKSDGGSYKSDGGSYKSDGGSYKSDGGSYMSEGGSAKQNRGSDAVSWKDIWSQGAYNSGRQTLVTCSYGVKFIAHPYECTKFYQCAHSKPFLFTCPSGLYFNTELEVCDWPSNVECQNTDSNDPGSYKTPANSNKFQGSNHKSDYERSGPQRKPTQPASIDTYSSNSYKEESNMDYDKEGNVQVSFSDRSQPNNYKPSSFHPGFFAASGKNFQDGMSAQVYPVGFHLPIIPVIHSPLYHPVMPAVYWSKQGNHKEVDDHNSDKKEESFHESHKSSDESEDVSSHTDKNSKNKDDSIQTADKDETAEDIKEVNKDELKAKPDAVVSSQPTSNKVNVKIVKKVVVKKGVPTQQPKSVDEKTGSAENDASKYLYYYYYDDAGKNGGSDKNKDYQNIVDGKDKIIKPISKQSKNPYYYYYLDGSGNDRGKNYKQQSVVNYDYDNKYANDYDYMYDYSTDPGQVKHVISVGKNYGKNKFNGKSENLIKKDGQVTDEEVGFLHLDHRGGRAKSKSGSQGLGDLGSLLPLLLLGGASGGQQLLMTSLLLSKFKSSGSGSGKSSKGKSSQGKDDDLIKNLVLLSLLNGNGNTNANTNTQTPTLTVPNVQVTNGQFVDIVTGQPAVVIDPTTGQQVTPAQTSVNPNTGHLVVTATGNPVFLQDPVTGNLQQAIIGTAAPATGNALLPAVTARRGVTRRVGVLPSSRTGNFLPLTPPQNVLNRAAASVPGREAVNLIFLSPLTPSSLPPPISNNDGSATLIRGSLRDILGPDLASFISNVPLVPGQGPPNASAGNKQACQVVRSGETVPFRISPRSGHLLPSECDAIGKLLDKFVPTFLQNFVPSDAAFAGFGNNSKRAGSGVTPGGVDSVDHNAAPGATVSPAASSINDHINVSHDQNGCVIAVPHIVPQC